MSETEVVNGDQQILDHTRNLRVGWLTEVSPNGALPKSDEDRKFALALVDGLERVAVANKRIKAETKAADTLAQSTAVIADVLRRVGGKDILSNQGNGRIPDGDFTVIESVDIVDGELEIDPPAEDSRSFLDRMVK